ncbi:hypothetical protein BKA67DRAFT_678995 [Truncatella angustata]|uniref:Uncharacterized protein n=1 Tax=Truncatella angustata TaxID=152316 RepID=A0A9P8UK22_9PEZI|nr:uncharacterized protein BKA67DRAFT_678995 [Truncatella angustata]KAH6653443.1 hypothetical protein BKA67DRAFT_678995 [Truncatella angustata]
MAVVEKHPFYLQLEDAHGNNNDLPTLEEIWNGAQFPGTPTSIASSTRYQPYILNNPVAEAHLSSERTSAVQTTKKSTKKGKGSKKKEHWKSKGVRRSRRLVAIRRQRLAYPYIPQTTLRRSKRIANQPEGKAVCKVKTDSSSSLSIVMVRRSLRNSIVLFSNPKLLVQFVHDSFVISSVFDRCVGGGHFTLIIAAGSRLAPQNVGSYDVLASVIPAQ